MRPQSVEILNELKQLISQYRAEIPGGRRAWPLSIRSRVRSLFNQGMSIPQIASRCELSYHTVLSWIPKEERLRARSQRRSARTSCSPGRFSEVQIRQERAVATVTVATREATPIRVQENILGTPRIATVTVTLAGGLRIEGVTPEFLNSWLGEIQPKGARA